MTTISNVSYKDGRVIASDSKATMMLDDYDVTVKKILQVEGTNIIIEIAGDAGVAFKAVNAIGKIMEKYPKDDIEPHIGEIKASLAKITKKLKEDASRNAALFLQEPQGTLAGLIISQNVNGVVKSFKAQISVSYSPDVTFAQKDAKHIKEVVDWNYRSKTEVVKLKDGQSIAIGPDPRSQSVLDQLIKSYDGADLTQEDAKAINFALIRTFIERNKGVGWPVEEWDVNKASADPKLLSRAVRSTDMDAKTKDYVDHLVPLAYASLDVEVLKIEAKSFSYILNKVLKKQNDIKSGNFAASKEDSKQVDDIAEKYTKSLAQVTGELEKAKETLESEQDKAKYYIKQRNSQTMQQPANIASQEPAKKQIDTPAANLRHESLKKSRQPY
jgi:20S proteasome alpha/beta subunit